MPDEITRKTRSPEETFALGIELAKSLRGGDVVVLTGSLGAGKTALVRGIASGMRVKSHVSSPTFTLLHLHEAGEEGALPLHHFDLYRLEGADDFLACGLDEYIGGDSVSVIEWGDRVRDALPGQVMEIDVRYGQDPQELIFMIRYPKEWKAEKGRRAAP